ncbi:MAG: DUF6488 family protein [Arenicella sp.]|jgi:hypothetical protein|nr:DUF6488 family protein [Arenicella sp.]
MKIVKIAFFSALLLSFHSVVAHGDHEYDFPLVISESVAVIVAQRAATSMTRKDAGLGFGQLSENWATIPKEDKAIFKKGPGYYVVSILNRNESKTLYVLISESGDVYDANMSGDFNTL